MESKRWKDGDSARTMTKKYNEVVESVEKVQKDFNEKVTVIPQEINKIKAELNKKIESVSVEDLGLDRVDNTPDIEKPVSQPQEIAINRAVEDMLTSEPASEMEGAEDTTFITGVSVSGTKLILTF